MGFEDGEIDVFEDGEVGCFEDDGWGFPGGEGIGPAGDAEAPFIAGLEAGEVKFWAGCGEVVSGGFGEFEEVLGDFCTDGVEADVSGAGAAEAIAEVSGEGGGAAAFKLGAEDVCDHVDGLYLADVFVPELGAGFDEVFHHGDAGGVVCDLELYAVVAKVCFGTEEGFVFTDDDSGDFVKEDGSAAHGAGGEGGV